MNNIRAKPIRSHYAADLRVSACRNAEILNREAQENLKAQLRQLQSEHAFLQGQCEDRKQREETIISTRCEQVNKLREEVYGLKDQLQEKEADLCRVKRTNKTLQACDTIYLQCYLIACFPYRHTRQLTACALCAIRNKLHIPRSRCC